MLKIVKLPNPILRQRAKEITVITPEIKTLAKNMIATLAPKRKKPLGVGLAANQVGQLQRIFIMLMPARNASQRVAGGPEQNYQVVINPQILKASKQMVVSQPEDDRLLEGCLSIPGYYGLVNRPLKIKVKYQDLTGRWHNRGFGLPQSIYFQHELDHINGVLFIDRLVRSHPFYLASKTGKLREVANPF